MCRTPTAGRIPATARRRRRSSFRQAVALGAGLWLCALAGCGRQGDAPGALDLSRVPSSAELATQLKAARRGAGAGDADVLRSLRDYAGLLLRLKEDDSRAAAGDDLFALWDRRPDDPLLLELAVAQGRSLRRDDDLRQRLARPQLADTTTAWGLFVAGRTARAPGERTRLLQAAEARAAELTPLQRAWLRRRLAAAADDRGDGQAAVTQLIAGLPEARQTGGAALELWFWQDLVDGLLRLERLDDALHAADVAASLARQAGDDYRYQHARSRVGKVLAQRGEDEAALSVFAECADAAAAAGFAAPCALSLEGAMSLRVRRGEYREAVALGKRRADWDLAHRDTNNAVGALASLAKCYYAVGSQDSCDLYMSRVRELLAAYPRPRTVARLIPHLAYHHFQRGEFGVVDSLLASAERLAGASGAPDAKTTTLLMMVYQNLEMGRPEEVYRAIAQLQALPPALAKGQRPADAPVDLQLTLAGFYAEQGEFARAGEMLAAVEPRVRDGKDRYQLWRYHWEQGKLASLREDHGSARSSFEHCLELARGLDHADLLAESIACLGQACLAQDEVAAARELLAGALAANRVRNFKAEVAMRIRLGECLLRLGQAAAARDQLAGTAALLTRQPPRRLRGDLLLEQARVAAALGDAKGALGLLTTARGELEATGQGRTEAREMLGDELHRRVVETTISLLHDHPQLAAADGPGATTLILADACRWSASPWRDAPLAAAALRAWLDRPHDPVLAFFVGRERSFGWTLTGRDVVLFELPGRRELAALLGSALAGALDPGAPVDEAALAELGRRLMAPVAAAWPSGSTLRIVPDRGLDLTPWALLPIATAGGTEPALRHGPLVEAPSVGALVAARPAAADGRGGAPAAILAVGVDDADGPGRDGGRKRLRAAEAEARHLAATWPAGGRVDLRLGSRASWRELSQLDLSRYDVIHLASHVEMLQGRPDRSTMRLYEGNGSEPLTITAVGRLDLTADLVFLSGCEAARQVGGGGGLADFARAFLHAGARAVIAPSARVDDAAAQALAGAFYEHYRNQPDPAAALRSALLELPTLDPRWSHPFYWAFYHVLEQG